MSHGLLGGVTMSVKLSIEQLFKAVQRLEEGLARHLKDVGDLKFVTDSSSGFSLPTSSRTRG
jgi:hypothetical protein